MYYRVAANVALVVTLFGCDARERTEFPDYQKAERPLSPPVPDEATGPWAGEAACRTACDRSAAIYQSQEVAVVGNPTSAGGLSGLRHAITEGIHRCVESCTAGTPRDVARCLGTAADRHQLEGCLTRPGD